MKKRTLPLIMLLAGLSAAALAACGHEHEYGWKNSADGTTHWLECECGDTKDEGLHVDEDSNGKCDVCGAHVHNNYVWKSTAAAHWQECECGNKINESAHVDAKNNDTQDGVSDGKCDDCGREALVLFNTLGHGVAPANLYIVAGEKATEPAMEDDDAWKFKGWYKDSACTAGNEFDFDAEINEVTTVYAKWEEDVTPGASKAHAFELTKDAECLKDVNADGAVYFQFTADKDGRYTVKAGAGEYSQSATFTTTRTGNTVYGKDQTLREAHFDLDAGETVYVLFTYQGGGADLEEAKAGVLIADTVDEPLPEDCFPDGKYAGGNIELTVDRENKTLVYNGNTYSFRYIGGKSDKIVFTMSGLGIECYLIHKEDGSYVYAQKDGSRVREIATLYPVRAQEPIALSELAGYYEPEGETKGATKLYIYASDSDESTKVLYFQDDYYFEKLASYDTEQNKLTFGQYTVTVNSAADGSVESLFVTYTYNSPETGKPQTDTYIYIKKSDLGAAPQSPLQSNANYFGTSHTIRTPYGSIYFGETGYDAVTFLTYDSESGVYSVDVNTTVYTTYLLKFSSDNKVVELFDEAGEKIDTLTLFEYVFKDLPETETTVSLSAGDFNHYGYALFEVKTAGWYVFNIPDGVTVCYDDAEVEYLSVKDSPQIASGTPLILGADVVVGVYMKAPAAVSFTVAPAEPPAGWASDNPLVLQNNTATVTGITTSTTYYFKYVAPAAGSYSLHVFYDDGTQYGDSVIDYTVNGVSYSFGYNDDFLVAITVTAGQEFTINVTSGASAFSKESITVVFAEDLSVGATDVTLTGEPAEGGLTLSATVTAGKNYHLASDTHETAVTATANAAFTVWVQGGMSYAAQEENGVFTASIPAATQYFKIVSDASSIALSQTFAQGTQAYPIAASAAAGSNTITVDMSKTVYFTLPAGQYRITAGENDTVTLYNGETNLKVGGVFTVEEGDVLSCINNRRNAPATLTIVAVSEIFTAEQAGAYEGDLVWGSGADEVDHIVFSFDRFGVGVYDDEDVVIADDGNGTYSFSYTIISINGSKTYNISFSFNEDGTLHVNDTGDEFTMTKSAVGGGTYSGTAEDGSGNQCALTITVNDDCTEGTYVYNDGYDTYNFQLAITQNDDGSYLATYDVWGDMCNTIFTVDGYTLTIISTDDGSEFSNVTLTKEA